MVPSRESDRAVERAMAFGKVGSARVASHLARWRWLGLGCRCARGCGQNLPSRRHPLRGIPCLQRSHFAEKARSASTPLQRSYAYRGASGIGLTPVGTSGWASLYLSRCSRGPEKGRAAGVIGHCAKGVMGCIPHAHQAKALVIDLLPRARVDRYSGINEMDPPLCGFVANFVRRS